MAIEAVVKPEVQVIPSTDLPGLERALAEIDRLTAKMPELREKSKIEVKDTESYAAIGAVLSEVRLLTKEGKALFSPFDIIVERVRTFLKTNLQKLTNQCQEIEAHCLAKMKPYEQKEKEAAEKEEEQINKGADVKVSVKPSLPSIAGYRKTTNYRAVVQDVSKFLRASKERKELRKYIVLDEKELNKEAQDMKDVEAFEKRFPGVKCVKE